MSTETQIQRVFELGDNDKTIASELTSLCNLYSLTPDHLKFKWEAFALNTGCSIKPTLPYIKHLKNALQRELDRGRKTRKTIKGKVVTKRSQAMDLSEYGISQPYSEDSVESFMSTMMHSTTKPHKVVPLSSSHLTDTHISPMSSQFMTRKTSHLIESQHNPHLPLIDKPEQPSAIQFSHLEPPIQEYRYMFEKIKERADMLDERIEYISSLIIQAHQIELSNPTRPHQEPIYTCGRICSDSEDKLNETSVLLQTSKDLGMGRRVKLDLAGLEQYSLFPGQIVGLYGRNTNGEVFSVERILLPPLPEPCAPMQADNRPLEMITAAGPFTLNDDLSFQPLEDLLQMCATQKPDVILLMGPFVSSQHPRIFSGKIETLPEQIFADQIYKRLEQVLDILVHTHVLMVPHADDVTHMYPLFPQPALQDMKHPRIHMLSNPSFISINDHTMAIGNIDILFRLAREEIHKNTTDRMHELCLHLLQQHTYYPLFPHAVGDSIDSGQLDRIQLSRRPDLLILPSQLKHFTKAVQDTVCINPGHVCKQVSGGHYARIMMYPTENDRIRVDLFKL